MLSIVCGKSRNHNTCFIINLLMGRVRPLTHLTLKTSRLTVLRMWKRSLREVSGGLAWAPELRKDGSDTPREGEFCKDGERACLVLDQERNGSVTASGQGTFSRVPSWGGGDSWNPPRARERSHGTAEVRAGRAQGRADLCGLQTFRGGRSPALKCLTGNFR